MVSWSHQIGIDESELETYFKEFCRRTRLKGHFRNESIEIFRERHGFWSKSNWKPPKKYASLEEVVVKLENEWLSPASTPSR